MSQSVQLAQPQSSCLLLVGHQVIHGFEAGVRDNRRPGIPGLCPGIPGLKQGHFWGLLFLGCLPYLAGFYVLLWLIPLPFSGGYNADEPMFSTTKLALELQFW